MKRWLKIMLVIFICATILTGIGVGLKLESMVCSPTLHGKERP